MLLAHRVVSNVADMSKYLRNSRQREFVVKFEKDRKLRRSWLKRQWSNGRVKGAPHERRRIEAGPICRRSRARESRPLLGRSDNLPLSRRSPLVGVRRAASL